MTLRAYTARFSVLKNCREEYGEHTCDKRRSRSYIASKFPQFAIEGSFPEEDELWRPDERETPAHVAQRAKEVLDCVFEKDDEGAYFRQCKRRPSSLTSGI